MTEVALYARVSTDGQVERFGLAAQLHELRAAAAARGYVVPEGMEFIDDGWSGADLDRPALTRLRDAVRSRAVRLVLIHDLDRLSRDLTHQMLVLDEMERTGARIEFVTATYENSPEGQFMRNVRGAVAQLERAKIRERTLRGKREKARRGLYGNGPPPYGYRVDPGGVGGLAIAEAEAETVRWMYRHLAEEEGSLGSIVAALRAKGIPPRRSSAWAQTSVRRIITSRTYRGQAYYNRGQSIPNPDRKVPLRRMRPEEAWIPITVPAIVSTDLWERAQAQLLRNRVVLSGRPPQTAMLLTGILRCGACGRSYHSAPAHGYAFYRCSGRRRNAAPPPCTVPVVPAHRFDRPLWEAVCALFREPARLIAQADAYATTRGVRDVELQSEVEHLTAEVARLTRKEQRLVDLYAEADLPIPGLRERLDQARGQRRAVTSRLEAARRACDPPSSAEERQRALEEACAVALHGLEAATPATRRQVLRALVDRIVVRGDHLEIEGVLPTPPVGVRMEPSLPW